MYKLAAKETSKKSKAIIAQPGYKIGFDVGISDNDDTTYRENQHLWADFNQN